MPDHDPLNTDDTLRRERVVHAVRNRIAAAPPRVAAPDGVMAAVVSWWRPALIAAGLVAAAATLSLWQTRSTPAAHRTVAEALGLAQPIGRYVAGGGVDAWDVLTSIGRRK